MHGPGGFGGGHGGPGFGGPHGGFGGGFHGGPGFGGPHGPGFGGPHGPHHPFMFWGFPHRHYHPYGGCLGPAGCGCLPFILAAVALAVVFGFVWF